MVFHLIGLGLADEEDITLKGLRAVQRCSKVYLEAYTSILTVPRARLEELYGVTIEEAPRELVESAIEPILTRALSEDVALLVVGDPFGATTHCDLLARAKEMGVAVNVVHNASIMNAVGCCGLQLYRFGETISVPFFTRGWRPDSFYDKLAANCRAGLHTLTLLDIKVREPTMASLARGRPTYLPPRYMSVRQAIDQLLEVEDARREGWCVPSARAVGVARVGAPGQLVACGTLEELRGVDFGAPLHSLVLIGTAGADEEEMLGAFCTPAAAAPALSAAAAAEEDAAGERAAAAHAGESVGNGLADGGDSSDDDSASLGAGNSGMAGGVSGPAAAATATATAAAATAAAVSASSPEGEQVRGGLHKFNASEVDVEGGSATADDFLDAFGF